MTIKLEGWLATLDDMPRERVFAEMRRFHEEATTAEARAREMAPRFGEVAAGSADFDYTLRAEALHAVLRQIRKGVDPLEAQKLASAEIERVVTAHNQRGPKGTSPKALSWPRDTKSGDHIVWRAVRAIKRAAEAP